MKKFLFLVIAFVSFYNLYSFELKGRIVEKGTNQGLPAVQIVLKDVQDTTKFQVSQSDAQGKFTFSNIESSQKIVFIRFTGYEEYYSIIPVEEGTMLGKIELTPKSFKTDELVVEDKVPPAQMKGDTLEYDARAFKTNPNATAGELLQKMPGVMEEDGRVKAQGENVQRVLVDGKPFFGDDPNAALRNIPAEVISKIEVFDDKSEQTKFSGFDDGTTIKTINLVTQQKFRNGTFGNLYSGYGTEDHYKVGGVVNHFDNDQRFTIIAQSNDINIQNFLEEDLAGVQATSNNIVGPGGGAGRGSSGGSGRPRGRSIGGDVNDFLVPQANGISQTKAAGVNYSDKYFDKLETTTSYFYNSTINDALTDLWQEYVVGLDSGAVYQENNNSTTENTNHRFNLRANYNINEFNNLLFMPKITYQDYSGFSTLSSSTNDGSDIINSSFNDFNTNLEALNYSGDLLFRHRFEKPGRTLMTFLNTGILNNSGENNLFTTKSFERNSELFLDTINQSSTFDQTETKYSARIMYAEPLTKTAIIMTNFHREQSNNNSDRKTFNFNDLSGEYDLLNPRLSNVFESDYTKNEVGTGIRFFNPKSGLMMMLRAGFEWSELTTESTFPESSNFSRSFQNILPVGFINYKFNQQSNIRLMYRANTQIPTISQLQNVLDNSNPLQLKIGNPNLDQQFNHNLFLRYQTTNPDKGSVFFAMLNGSYSNDYVSNSVFISNRDTLINGINLLPGTQLTTQENLDGFYRISSFVNYGIPVSLISSNLNFNASLSYSEIPGLINNELNYVKSPNGSLGIVLSSNISEKLDFTLSSNTSYTISDNTLENSFDTEFLNQTTSLRFYYNVWNGLVFRSDLSHQLYTGLSDDFNQEFILWNMSLGYKFLKEDRGELMLSVNDLLKQNTSISRTITDTFVQDNRTAVLQQYFMLTFRYDLRHYRGI